MASTYILPMRFELREDAPWANLQVATFDYPYGAVKTLQTNAMAEKKKLKNSEYPPLGQLGTVLNILIPGLIHPFFFDTVARRTQPLMALPRPANQTSEEENYHPMMAFSDASLAWLPSTAKIFEVIKAWARLWLRQDFLKLSISQQETFLKAFEQDLYALEDDGYGWRAHTLQDIWQKADPKLYRVLPSLFASLLMDRTQKEPAQLEGLDIHWFLAQNYDRLQVLSDVISGEKGGSYAYSLRFSVHNHAGSDRQWIYPHIQVQRYLGEGKEVRLNYGRNATVYFAKGQPYAQWQDFFLPSTFAALSMKNWKWQENILGLLTELNLVNNPISAEALKERLEELRNPREQEDAYRVVYSEGMRPTHRIKTGLSMEGRRQTMVMIDTLLGDWLQAGEPLKKDPATYNPRIGKTLREREFFKDKNRAQKVMAEATERALGLAKGDQVVILICYHQPDTPNLIRQKIAELYGLNEGNPEVLEIIALRIPENLLAPLHYDPENRQTRVRAQKHALYSRYKDWEKWLASNLQHNHLKPELVPCLAMIELPANSNPSGTQYNEKVDIKSAVRAAFAQKGILSQMIMPDAASEADTSGDHRIESAIKDLLLRQTGSVFSSAAEFFASKVLLGGDALAQQLHVTAIYRHRPNEYQVDFPLAVRWSPDGRMQAYSPHDAKWLPYWQMHTHLGKYFYDSRQSAAMASNENINPLKLDKDALMQFLHDVITEQPDKPNLILLDAEDWRSVWPQLNNKQMERDKLKFTENHLYTTTDLPHTRIIRLRQGVTNYETPQYVALKSAEWRPESVLVDDAEEIQAEIADSVNLVGNIEGTYASGFVDTDVNSTSKSFYHYASIARIPDTADKNQRKFDAQDPKHQKGGKIAYKHQTILEVVPFFLQPEDDPHQWALIVNFMRSTPAWKVGNIGLPYPLHLAAQCLDDMMDTLGAVGSDD